MASLSAGVGDDFRANLAQVETVFLDLVDLVDLHHTFQVCKDHRVLPLAHLGLRDPLVPLHLDKVYRRLSVDLLTEETALHLPSFFLVSLVNLQWVQCLLARLHQDTGLPQAPHHLNKVLPLPDPSHPVHLGP